MRIGHEEVSLSLSLPLTSLPFSPSSIGPPPLTAPTPLPAPDGHVFRAGPADEQTAGRTEGRIGGDGGQARTGDVSDGGAAAAALAPLLLFVRQRRRPQSDHARRKGQSGFATIIISLESIPTAYTTKR